MIKSTTNPVVKRMRSLSMRKYRRREGAAVVYGVQPVTQAVESECVIQVIAYSPELLRNAGAVSMVKRLEKQGVQTVEIEARLFTRLSERDGPGGLAAIVEVSPEGLPGDSPFVDKSGVVVVLDRIANPGNLGTIMRSADAAGADGVVLVGATADPYDPVGIRASMGAVFNVPFIRLGGVLMIFSFVRTIGSCRS